MNSALGPRLCLFAIDDDWVELEALSRGVSRLALGWELRAYEDSRIALEELEAEVQLSGRTDHVFVLLDLNMPILSGFELLERIRELPQLRALRVAVLTSSDHPSDVDRSRALGAIAHISKSDSGDDFETALILVERLWAEPEEDPRAG